MASSGSNDEADQSGSTRQKSELLSMASSGSNDEADQSGSTSQKSEQSELLPMEGSSSKAKTETPCYVCLGCGSLIVHCSDVSSQQEGYFVCELASNVTFGQPYDKLTDIRADMFCVRCDRKLGWKFITVIFYEELHKAGQIALSRKEAVLCMH